ncbi:hypothetical protein FCE95_02960 [Luteimonas gilva]|uniref:DUF1579 domain-containing protein n=1 Tax=Luteimonas gilva TaxID=2572684 RepID=A0A4U5JTX3_9GAMM|nr:hypothetical protein [Luteimonas gilva]TKR33284.1 hypothetical protein FCE95_02960 [Luteimonas gilva]
MSHDFRHIRNALTACALAAALHPQAAPAQNAPQSATAAASARTDGQHGFDFEFGKWKTQLKRRLRPLSGSDEWVEYEGTSVVTKVLNGRANMVELDVQGPAGRIEGASWRLYNPETRQWSLNFANARDGMLTSPVFGGFENGRGVFYGTDTLGGRTILVRFVISDISADSVRFEQSYSDNGGETWESNWIAVDTRIRD